jgi:hypothetical protein
MLRGFRHGRTGFAQVLMTLAFVAIVMRTFVPAGYMLAPSEAARGAFVVICSGTGHKAYFNQATGKVVYGEQPTQPQEDSKRGADTPCVFAMSAHWGPPQQAPQLPFALAASAERPAPKPKTAPAVGAAAPPPWSTGPPATA